MQVKATQPSDLILLPAPPLPLALVMEPSTNSFIFLLGVNASAKESMVCSVTVLPLRSSFANAELRLHLTVEKAFQPESAIALPTTRTRSFNLLLIVDDKHICESIHYFVGDVLEAQI